MSTSWNSTNVGTHLALLTISLSPSLLPGVTNISLLIKLEDDASSSSSYNNWSAFDGIV
ncbi:hypothetical protein FH972_027367 [Carpinus fangiana]|uniref:Uncharacterized protein n=1 Tax=Carpinus fangiana TaxID=176857 RepID=A0A5N6Q7R4_9ROSI|nr:hypothetical protein FH972_027367 [Carpinus fangiana]